MVGVARERERGVKDILSIGGGEGGKCRMPGNVLDAREGEDER